MTTQHHPIGSFYTAWLPRNLQIVPRDAVPSPAGLFIGVNGTRLERCTKKIWTVVVGVAPYGAESPGNSLKWDLRTVTLRAHMDGQNSDICPIIGHKDE